MTYPKTPPNRIDWRSITELIDALPHAAAVLRTSGEIGHENLGFRALRLQANPTIPTSGILATLGPSTQARVAFTMQTDPNAVADDLLFDWHLPGCPGAPQFGKITPLRLPDAGTGVLFQVTENRTEQDPRLRYLMEHLVDGVWDYDLRTGRFTTSDAWHGLRGLPDDHAVDLASDEWLDRIHPDDRDAMRRALHAQREGNPDGMVIQYRHLHEDGHWVWILCRASVVEKDDNGRPLRIIGTDTDITEAMESQEAVNQLADKLKLAVEASGMGIWEFNPDTQQVHWDDRMLEIYGITDGQNIRSDNLWEKHLHPDDYDETVAYAEECKRHDRDFKRDYRIVQPCGRVCHIRSLARTVILPNRATRLIGVNIDVTQDYQRAQELETARAQLEHDALHDELTGLGNRRALDQSAIALFKRLAEDKRYAVMQVDLDHFKDVNDTLGHSAGDFVLEQVARILRDVVGDLGRPFRVGGDEFSIFFESAPDPQALDALSEEIIEAISVPMAFEGQPCSVGASIGYAIGAGPPASQSSIFIDADTALYAAKRAGRYTYRAYTDEVGREFHILSSTGSDLREAIRADQIVCHLQPQYDANTLEIIGAEALVRWHCPKRGLLAPADFLPSAVDAGLLDAIDHCIFQRVADLQTDWHRRGLEFPRIAVNVSRARLEDGAFLEQTREALQDHHKLAFELLETAFYDSPSNETLFKLEALRELNIRIEMDDFGTGYASVKALQALKPDAVKTDRTLVAPLGTRATQFGVLQNLSKIARLEGAEVVLEGLETGAHIAAIRKLDCDVLQGYALQRPMPELDFAALLHAGSASAKGQKHVG